MSVDSKQAGNKRGGTSPAADHEIHPERLDLRFWLRMLSTTKMISQEIRRRLRLEFGATLPQFDVMAQLYREADGLRLGELSKRTMVTNGNITSLVDRLESTGFIRRATESDDRRVTVAKLTDQGRETFAAMAKAHEGWLCDILADIDSTKVETLLKLLATVDISVKNRISVYSTD